MTYYKVKANYDNAPRYIMDGGRRLYDSSLIGGELYTEKERARFIAPVNAFEVVTLSPKNTYRSFGARFECR